MIPFPGGARVWLATGRTDMRKGMNPSGSHSPPLAASSSRVSEPDV
jgi:hypothetical protein